MANPRSQPPDDVDRFVAALNALDHIPTWAEATRLGVALVDLSREEFALRSALNELKRAQTGFDTFVDPVFADATAADIADHRARLEQIEAQPGRFFLASGAVVQRDDLTGEAYRSGWWYDQRTTLVTTPHGDRVHRLGIHPDASIDPTAQVDPTARVEAGATIGPRTRIGAHVHVGRDATIGANSVVQDGSWIGTHSNLGAHTWVSHGVTIEPHSVVGHHATIGAGSRVTQGCEVEPYSRLGSGTTTSRSPAPHSNRGVQVANAVENLMRLDRE